MLSAHPRVKGNDDDPRVAERNNACGAGNPIFERVRDAAFSRAMFLQSSRKSNLGCRFAASFASTPAQ